MKRLNPKTVKIVEVGLRDGLQNEATFLTVGQRLELLDGLIEAGAKNIELGAFVSPKWVPQMAGTEQIIEHYFKRYDEASRGPLRPTVLVPNALGMVKAVESGIKEVAVFISCTETFSQKNINCSIAESLARVSEVIASAQKNKIAVRGYLSVCFGCPYEGEVSEKTAVDLAKKLFEMGCYEISIGDTIGIAHPLQVESLMSKLTDVIPSEKIAGHFHDTRGLALANILAAYHLGISVFDSSIAGLGGCPYAKGSSGNVATEDVVHMFERMNVVTGFNLQKLVETNLFLGKYIQHPLESKVSRALSGV